MMNNSEHAMRASLLSYKNLKLMERGQELRSIMEYILYSDSHFIGGSHNDSTTTYSFLNMLPLDSRPSMVTPAITVRSQWYVDINKTIHHGFESHTEDFHGGWFNDEIAALSSLLIGVRFHAGTVIRYFDYYSGQLGMPQADYSLPPHLSFKRNTPIVPSAVKSISIDTLCSLNSIKDMSEKNFNFLIKAARNYQNALWICETSPNMAWLLLVSALETAAQQWNEAKESAIDRFKNSKPGLYKVLDTDEFRELIPTIAEEFSSTFGAAKKFRDFCSKFSPDEPTNRPEWGKIEWNKKNLREIFNTVYSHRSKALHGGQPFPEPMCSHPESYNGIAEVGLSSTSRSTLGGTWTPKDAPINLNTFNLMVHSILNKWWLSLYPNQSS